MKFFAVAICLFFSVSSFSNVSVPTGEYQYSDVEIKMVRHTVLLFNASSVDMEKMSELRAEGYSCKRFPRRHRCQKTYQILPSNVEVFFTPPFERLSFSDKFEVQVLVSEAVVNQYLVSQVIQYDDLMSESSSYKVYVYDTGVTYLDPTLDKMVRFKYVNSEALTHLNIVNERVSSKEFYKVYFEARYEK